MNNSLDKLRNIEIDILNIGDKISDLFEEIDSIYKGKHFEEPGNETLNFESVLTLITNTRENLHKEVEELYNVNNYPYLNKVSNGLSEREKEIKQINEFFNELANR